MDEIPHLTAQIVQKFLRLLPFQRKTQRENIALLVATMLYVRSANLMDLAAGLPRNAQRIDMRFQWIWRVLINPLIEPDEVMAPFAREAVGRVANARQPVVLIMDQSRLTDSHQVLMLALRQDERALPLFWRVEQAEGTIRFETQKELLEAAAPALPENASICLMADRFYGTADLISFCQYKNWDYRIRLKGNLTIRDKNGRTTSGELAKNHVFALENVRLTSEMAETNIDVIPDSGHEEPWLIAMPAKPGYLKTLEHSSRWAIEPMFSDFNSRGFGIKHSQIQYSDRLSRLLMIMALALYFAAAAGWRDAKSSPSPAEKDHP